MNGSLYRFFADDHRRLEGLLERATARPGEYLVKAYAQFRTGLLRHIKMEETILLPTAQKARGGEPLPIAAKIRLDHGADGPVPFTDDRRCAPEDSGGPRCPRGIAGRSVRSVRAAHG
jgi:hypothetical protein